MNELLTIQEAADELRVSRQTVGALIRDQKLVALRLGPQTIRIRRSDLEAFLDANRSFSEVRS